MEESPETHLWYLRRFLGATEGSWRSVGNLFQIPIPICLLCMCLRGGPVDTRSFFLTWLEATKIGWGDHFPLRKLLTDNFVLFSCRIVRRILGGLLSRTRRIPTRSQTSSQPEGGFIFIFPSQPTIQDRVNSNARNNAHHKQREEKRERIHFPHQKNIRIIWHLQTHQHTDTHALQKSKRILFHFYHEVRIYRVCVCLFVCVCVCAPTLSCE